MNKPIIDSCVRANEGPPPSSAWTSSIDSDDGGLKIVSNQMAPNAVTSSALWNTQYGGDLEVYCTINAFPTSGPDSIELWINIRNGDTATPSGYICRFWHSSGGGVGAIELDRNDSGALTRLDNASKTLAVGDVFGFARNGNDLVVYVNSVVEAAITGTDTTHAAGRQIGIRILEDDGLLTRLSAIGGGGDILQLLRPDADTDAGTWTTAPLWSKVDEASAGGDVITGTN